MFFIFLELKKQIRRLRSATIRVQSLGVFFFTFSFLVLFHVQTNQCLSRLGDAKKKKTFKAYFSVFSLFLLCFFLCVSLFFFFFFFFLISF